MKKHKKITPQTIFQAKKCDWVKDGIERKKCPEKSGLPTSVSGVIKHQQREKCTVKKG